MDTLEDLIRIYDNSASFRDFFKVILDIFQGKKKIILKIISIEENIEYIDVLNIFLNKIIQTDKRSKLQKKKQGFFLTNKKICRFINQRVLYNYCKNSIQAPNVLDPSCGIGYFIIDMIFLLISYNSPSNPLWIDENLNLKNMANIIKNQISGVDINKDSIKITQSLISIIFLAGILFSRTDSNDITKIEKLLYDQTIRTIRQNINVQDFLQIDKTVFQGKFDIIVGNPPYIRVHKIDPELKQFLRQNFYTPYKDFDIYITFFEQSLYLIKKKGIIGFITPEKFLLRDYAKKLRLFLIVNAQIIEIIDVSRCSEIFQANTYPLITILMKNKNEIEIPSDLLDINNLISVNMKNSKFMYLRIEKNFLNNMNSISNILNHTKNSLQTFKIMNTTSKYFEYAHFLKFLKNPGFRFEFILDPNLEIIEDIFSHYIKLGNILDSKCIFCGTPRAKDYHNLRKGLYNAKIQRSQNDLKYIISRNISPYGIIWGQKVNTAGIFYENPFYDPTKPPFSKTLVEKFRTIPKILIKANSKRITSALDKVGYAFNGIYSIILRYKSNSEMIKRYNKELLEEIDEYVIISILNSNLMNYYIQKKFQSYMLRSRYISINKAIIGSIPLPILLDPPNEYNNDNNRITTNQKNNIVKKFLTLKRLSKKLTMKLEILIKNFIITTNYSENLKDSLLKKVKNYDFNSINFEEKYFSEVDKIKKHEILALFAELSQLREQIELKIYEIFEIPEKTIEKIEFHFLYH